jgi:quinol monooxygenase YgiN
MTSGAADVFATFTTGRFCADGRDAAITVLREMVELDHREPGTLVQAFHIDRSEPNVFRVYELWASQEALEVHRRNGSRLRVRLGPLVEGDFEVHVCDPLVAKGVPFDGP